MAARITWLNAQHARDAAARDRLLLAAPVVVTVSGALLAYATHTPTGEPVSIAAGLVVQALTTRSLITR